MKATAGKTELPSTTKSGVRRGKRPSMAALPTFTRVFFQVDQIGFELSDGRTILIPLFWSKPLAAASPAQREAFEITDLNIFWDELDEIIGVENLLYGKNLYLH